MQEDGQNKSKTSFVTVMVVLIIIIAISFITGLFWYQTKSATVKFKSTIKNMQGTVQKAHDLQKQLNKQFKNQEDLLKNLDNR